MKKIQIVIGESGWIIEAIAKQWMDWIKGSHGEVSVECVYGHPVVGAETYLHFIYLNATPVAGARNIVFVTHVDYFVKGLVLIKLALQGVEFVSMSLQTKNLIERFVPGAVVHCISPTSLHFGSVGGCEITSLTLGLFFRLYPDKRKNNALVASLISKVCSAPHGVKLIIYGAGFEEYIENIDLRNIIYDNSSFSPKQYRNYLEQCDYVLYFGRDEGAISILDAGCLSVPVLATRQGYHIDIPLPKGSMLFQLELDVLKAAENLIDTMYHTESVKDPVTILEQKPVIKNRRWIWYFSALFTPFKRNPFRASDDWPHSLKQLALGICRRMVSWW
jgi:hypothetical protein